MITPEVFDGNHINANTQRVQLANALAQMVGQSIAAEREVIERLGHRDFFDTTGILSWMNGTFRLEHQASWHDTTDVTVYGFRGGEHSTYSQPTIVAHLSTSVPKYETRPSGVGIVGPRVSAGFAVTQTFEGDFQTVTGTHVAPELATGLLGYSERRGKRLALPVMNQLVEDYPIAESDVASLAPIIRTPRLPLTK